MRDEKTRRPFAALLLVLGAALPLGAAQAAEAQQLQGGVQQNEGAPSTGDQFNSQSPDFNAQTPGESFNSQSFHFSASACAEDKTRLANKTKLPPGWGPPQLISPDELYRHPSEYWAFYKNYDCRPGVALAYRNLNYGKSPPPGQTGWYPGFTSTTNDPSKWTPPPDVPGGIKFCDNPNAWRYPQCQQQASVTPPRAPAPPPCEKKPSPAQEISLRRTVNEVIYLLRGSGSQANHMLDAFGDSVRAGAAQLIDPKAFLAKQIENVQALLALLAQDNRSFNAALYEAQLATLREVERDPAGAIGKGVAQRILGQAAVAVTGTVCQVTLRATQAGVNRLRVATDRLKKIKAIVDNQPLPPGSQAGACPSVNPTNLKFGCFQRSIAWELRAETGHDWVAPNFKWGSVDAPTPRAQSQAMLWSLWGDRRFKSLTAEENIAQAGGNFIPMSLQAIKDNLKEAGDGARGLIVAQPRGVKVDWSHQFNVSLKDGVLEFYDAEKAEGKIEYLHRLFDPQHFGHDMDFWLYRTAGPDRLSGRAFPRPFTPSQPPSRR
jgi:hypothetical protein